VLTGGARLCDALADGATVHALLSELAEASAERLGFEQLSAVQRSLLERVRVAQRGLERVRPAGLNSSAQF
jgi:hypothetical protein